MPTDTFSAEAWEAEARTMHTKCPGCHNKLTWQACKWICRATMHGNQRILYVLVPVHHAEWRSHAYVADVPDYDGGTVRLTGWDSVASAIESAAGDAMSDHGDRGLESSRLVTLARELTEPDDVNAEYVRGQANLICDYYGYPPDEWNAAVTNMITSVGTPN